MNEINWDDLRLFLAVAQSGGLGAATAETGKSAPTLGRRMLALERSLGQDLFNRKPRGYELTERGEALLKQAAEMEAHIGAHIGPNPANKPLIAKISAGTWVSEMLCRNVDKIWGEARVTLRMKY